jgi:hypothetical protein
VCVCVCVCVRDYVSVYVQVIGTLSHTLQLLPPHASATRPRVRLAYVSTDLGDHPVGHQAQTPFFLFSSFFCRLVFSFLH